MAVVPPQGLILVTGANGHVAGVTIKTLLDRGYRVRGTVRSASKHSWMPSYYGANFSLAEVPDFGAPGAFDDALAGVDGVIHMAADVTFTHDRSIIDVAVRGVTNLLEAASHVSSVKSVALTSAKAACANEHPGVEYTITADTWNEEALAELKKPDSEIDQQRLSMLVYAGQKVNSERAAWDFVREKKPHYSFNSVLPNVNIGPIAAIEHLGYPSGSALLNAMDKGYPLGPMFIPQQWYVNTEDTVLLHLAALTLEEVNGERLIAMAGPFAWNDIVEILRRRFPEREKMVKHVDEAPRDIGHVDNARSAEVLRKMGRDGFRSLEDSLVEGMKDIIAADKLEKVPRAAPDDLIDMLFNGGGAGSTS
jgi:nucleoside-diphosphate-sugar epimerase